MTLLNTQKPPVHSEPEIFISLYSPIPRLYLTFIKFL